MTFCKTLAENETIIRNCVKVLSDTDADTEVDELEKETICCVTWVFLNEDEEKSPYLVKNSGGGGV